MRDPALPEAADAVLGGGEEGLALAEERLPELVRLDWMLATFSGLDVCRALRGKPATRRIPVIMLTARGAETDKIRGLDSGADDDITKPFSPGAAEQRLEYGGVVTDLVRHRVTRGEREVPLRPAEYRLLRHLLEHPRRLFSREQILDAVWGGDIFLEQRPRSAPQNSALPSSSSAACARP